jgi:glycosyltransferase involved in cell wall biosynthesis
MMVPTAREGGLEAAFSPPARTVLIIEPELKQYRRAFFVALAARLQEVNVHLRVAYSPANRRERSKADGVDLGDTLGLNVRGWWLFRDRLLVQPLWRVVGSYDLIILEQANKLVLSYPLLVLSHLGLKRVAYWGHGYNHQETHPGVSEWLKRRLLTKVSWWFAYTESVARYLVAQGVRPDSITNVQNTIDTQELMDAIASQSPAAKSEIKRRLGIAPSAPVALFCGSLYHHKKLDFLIEAASAIRREIPDFELVIVGDGPERPLVEVAGENLPFIHYVGPAFGRERAVYFSISDVFLMPGLVGLAVVDAFAAGLPVMTTAIPTHSPEIEYLEHGHNGLISTPETSAFAEDVVRVLRSPDVLRAMQWQARRSAERLTLAHMVNAFAAGILECLGKGA